MRQYDLPSLYRSTIGFDRLFSMLDQVSGEAQSYPPYNIERVGEERLSPNRRRGRLFCRGSRDRGEGECSHLMR